MTALSKYTVCNILKPDGSLYYKSPFEPNNWLLSDLIQVREVNRVDVTVKYSITPCPPLALYCKEYFDAYVWESDSTVVRDKIPHPININGSYRRFASFNRQSSGFTVVTVPLVLSRRYFVLGFRDQGGCRTLNSVKVTYNVCPRTTLSRTLVSVPRTLAPSNDRESISVLGECAANSVLVSNSLNVLCESSGEWNITRLGGGCVCKEDMENIEGQCAGCKKGKYNDRKGLNCTELPSAPRSVTATFLNQSVIGLTWKSPEVIGDQSHVFYDVRCLRPCNNDAQTTCAEEPCQNDVKYIPFNKGLNTTTVLVTNLSPFVNYTFKIYARNRVSEVAKRRHGIEGDSAVITLTTVGTVPGRPELFVEQNEVTVSVSWTLQHKNGIIKNYEVTYVREDNYMDRRSIPTNKTKHEYKDLQAGKTYKFQVFAENNYGRGPIGEKTFTVQNGGDGFDKLVVLITAGGGSLLFVCVVVFIIIIFLSRRRKSLQRDYIRGTEHGSDLGQQRYIDPTNYSDLMELLTTLTTEIEKPKIKLQRFVGQGEFADVYKGTLKTRNGRDVVAVKVLRPGSNEKNQKDFLSEASIMGQFNHPNVIKLVGVVTKSRPMMILTEFLESGSLDKFLKEHKGLLTSLQLVGMARGVACGIVYLSEMNLIHRDLAARNILVGENMLCKVSDFGLSRELAEDSPVYETQGGKIAVRWTSPEALQHRVFSSASDVWSYGILLWEIMSFADRPYWGWSNSEVMDRVQFGYRLPAPKDCPEIIHGIMMDCWQSDPSKRPKFEEIVNRLDKIIRSPEVLEIVPLLQSTLETSEEIDAPQFESVDEWLNFINMECYLETFQAANVDSLDKVRGLRDEDLRDMGVKQIGHRNKINKSIKAIKEQHAYSVLEVNELEVNETFF
ncbi:ephrin type-A receptor 4-like isoform X5 [Porites lutea]